MTPEFKTAIPAPRIRPKISVSALGGDGLHPAPMFDAKPSLIDSSLQQSKACDAVRNGGFSCGTKRGFMGRNPALPPKRPRYCSTNGTSARNASALAARSLFSTSQRLQSPTARDCPLGLVDVGGQILVALALEFQPAVEQFPGLLS